MNNNLSLLVPSPQQMDARDGTFFLAADALIYLGHEPQIAHIVGQYLSDQLTLMGLAPELTATEAGDPPVRLRIDAAAIPRSQSYRLIIDQSGVSLIGGDAPGLFYGVCTLVQLVRLHRTEAGADLPHLQIVDWPDFAQRGVMLDVSRDKVPTLETLLDLVDLLASLKVNQLQLYTEHTFAYRGHEVVWQDASPLTGEEILELDAYCQMHFVELVPNQNSFGHMHRWLKHDHYRHLAEVPEGWHHPFHDEAEPYSLCPLDPGSLELLEDLYDQLLPHFSSSQFNVGLDETFDLGMGRSKEACAERGTERIYLDFLLEIHERVRRRGKTMQFWGDIILHQPDLIAELPKDVIALEWGYEADHPFAEHGKHFADAGLSFYVCPGTSSWNTLGGRTDNAIGNLRNAATNGKKHGAIGYLNTDWGDFGHMQPLPVSYLGYLVGAAFSWNASDAERADALDVPALLDRHVFGDDAGVMGQLAYDLGNTYQQAGTIVPNSSALFWQFIFPGVAATAESADEGTRIEQWVARMRNSLSSADYSETVDYIDRVVAQLDEATMSRSDADLVQDEFRWVADMLRFAARLGAARQSVGLDQPVSALPADQRQALAAELRDLIERHRQVWLARNRPGGLADSTRWSRRLLAMLDG